MTKSSFTFIAVLSLLFTVGRVSGSYCESFKDCSTCTRTSACQWVQYQNCTFGCVDYYEPKTFGPRLKPWRKSIGINVTSTRYTCSENLECKSNNRNNRSKQTNKQTTNITSHFFFFLLQVAKLMVLSTAILTTATIRPLAGTVRQT